MNEGTEITRPRFAVAAAKPTSFVLPFSHIDRHDLPRVGGKGANLGEMTRAGFPVPGGFCVTTEAFRVFLDACGDTEDLFAALDAIDPEDTEAVRVVGQRTRERLLKAPVPSEVREAIVESFHDAGEGHAYAVRSSATAEDLPGASFAGQQDTYLNVRGRESLIERVRECWVSLFTDRAITYRARNRFDHRKVYLSVVVQRMAFPDKAGILFTADPITGNRNIASIDAGFGLGEALVSGLVSADLYRVDKTSGAIVERKIADKTMAIRPLPEGGTRHEDLGPNERTAQVLEDGQIGALTELAKRIEAHYGTPQDIEWCLEGDELFVVQSRPITTLFPVPAPAPTDGTMHVYVSFGHAQVMTDAMAPLARAVWKRILPIARDAKGDSTIIKEAGGRLYLDPTELFRRELFRTRVPKVLRAIDALMADGVAEATSRESFLEHESPHSTFELLGGILRLVGPVIAKAIAYLFFVRPEGAPARALAHADAGVAKCKAKIDGAKSGAARIRAAREAIDETFETGMLPILPLIVGGIMAMLLCKRLLKDRGVDRELDLFARGLEGNVTTEMDLAIGDLADVARSSPELVRHLKTCDPTTARSTVRSVKGGDAFADALESFLDRYGMRGGSEIDITRTRWRDDPSPVIQTIVGNLARDEKGSHRTHHAKLATEGRAAMARMIDAASPLKRPLVRRAARVARVLLAIREHPKFQLIRHMGLTREAIRFEARELLDRGLVDQPSDVWFLSLDELIDALDGVDGDLRARIESRRADHERFQKMTPPRVLTSEGESVVARHTGEDLPEGAIGGSAASAGVVEGIAKVILDPTTSVLQAGEILVAPFTDPGWTPLFINAAGLVMEVGGLMTHGSVVAREYGIPAVVCVPDATKRIRTGQRIRVDGDRGFVQILE